MSQSRQIVIVGGGISGCLCALFSSRAGYQVTLVARGSDPRQTPEADPYSATLGGEDSRYVTLTEGHPYLGTGNYINQMYPDMQGAFMRSIGDGGWLSQPIELFSERERQWLHERYLANEQGSEISRVFNNYIQQNRQSMQLWNQLFRDTPELARGISLNNSGILRLYGNDELLETAKTFQDEAGVLLDVLSVEQTVGRFPVLKQCVQKGFLRGALVVEGLTFRVQQLIRNILDELEQRGAELCFHREVAQIVTNCQGQVCGVRLSSGEFLVGDHYSFHLGAYDQRDLLGAFDLAHFVMGVAGGWIVLPCPSGPFLPIKVHDGQHVVDGKLRPVVDLNINPAVINGERVLIVGGGYLFVGSPPFHFPEESTRIMLAETHRVAEIVLGDFYRRMKARGAIVQSDRICVRSFTPNDEELSFVTRTDRGGVATVGGGGNTGSTAKAAWVANEFIRRVRQSEIDLLVSRRWI